jgi:glutaconyl-CoA/methylmalonyl-CoA decarboxylase subunit delta
MEIFGNILYMYVLAAVISFFVAFLINSIFFVINYFEKNKKKEEHKFSTLALSDVKDVQKEAGSLGLEGEVYAAIAMALNLYTKEIHDDEKLKMTIQKSVKPYSPWSSKIYGVSQWRR